MRGSKLCRGPLLISDMNQVGFFKKILIDIVVIVVIIQFVFHLIEKSVIFLKFVH